MNVIVFGATGFIGGHVVEQLQRAGHRVTIAVRHNSNTEYLRQLNLFEIRRIDFSNTYAIQQVMEGNEVAYNCTADTNLSSLTSLEDAPVEIQLTKKLVEAAVSAGIRRFVQLSSIVVYDFQSQDPIDETYRITPEFPIQQLMLERERMVMETSKGSGMETFILRPASTIGVRDRDSFFARLFAAHQSNQYPMIGDGSIAVSLVDTRDIGRAMAWMADVPKQSKGTEIYLLKGFDTTWRELKNEMDQAVCYTAQSISIPMDLSGDSLQKYGVAPFAYKTFTTNRIWNDQKIRRRCFEPRYSLREAVQTEVQDLLERRKEL